MPEHYATAALAQRAAERLTNQTGWPHGMLFWPRHREDPEPFLVDLIEAIRILERRG